jgi:hypothetical protein
MANKKERTERLFKQIDRFIWILREYTKQPLEEKIPMVGQFSANYTIDSLETVLSILKEEIENKG